MSGEKLPPGWLIEERGVADRGIDGWETISLVLIAPTGLCVGRSSTGAPSRKRLEELAWRTSGITRAEHEQFEQAVVFVERVAALAPEGGDTGRYYLLKSLVSDAKAIRKVDASPYTDNGEGQIKAAIEREGFADVTVTPETFDSTQRPIRGNYVALNADGTFTPVFSRDVCRGCKGSKLDAKGAQCEWCKSW